MLRSFRVPEKLDLLLRPHYLVLLVTVIIAGASLTLMNFILDNGQNRSEREVTRKLELTVGTLNRSIENSFNRVVELLDGTGQALLKDATLQADSLELRTLLAQRVNLIGGLNELVLFNRYGEQLARSGRITTPPVVMPDCLPLALAPVSEGVYISRPAPGRFIDEPHRGEAQHHHIPFCIGIRDWRGELQAALIAAVDTRYFSGEFEPIQKLSTARIELFSPTGVLLASTPDRRLLIGGSFTDLAFLSAGPLFKSHDSYQQGDTLYSYRRAETLPLVTVARQDVAQGLSEWLADAKLIRALFISLALLSLLAGLMIFRGMRRQARMADEIQLLTTAISTTANSIFITDHKGRIRWVNDAFERLTGWGAGEVLGQTPRLFNSGHHDPLFFRDLWQTLMAGEVWRGQVTNQNRKGDMLLVEQTITPILNTRGRLTHFVAIHEDVTERTRAEQQARYLSRHDQLTGLPNRRFLGEALVQALERPDDLLLIFIDLDRFKTINDTQGHEVGDALLCLVSDRLSARIGDQGIVARLGGDEFAVLLSGEAANMPEQQLRLLLAQMSEPYRIDGRSYNLTVSIGVTIGSDRQRDAAALLRQADLAMFRAKQDGRNTFCFFEPDMDQLFHRHVQLDQGLRSALASDTQLSLRYQPILEAASLQPVAVEVLTRWRNDQGEWVSPAEFIPVAEDSGLIIELGRWQIEQLFQQLVEWRGTELDALRVSINVSAVQLARDNIADHLLERMAWYGIPARRMLVEITETALMASKDRVQHNLNMLHKAGVQLSIDDFGTGYSSLAYISDFNAGALKIDRSFVIGIGNSRSDEEIIETMLGLAHNLGIAVVAEGVDDPRQLAFLQNAGCQMVQGFLFAKPMTATDLVTFMDEYQPEFVFD